jgi:hypothetical protein
MTIKRMDNVGIVVEDIDAAIEFSPNLASSSRGVPQSKETGQMASLDCATCASRLP